MTAELFFLILRLLGAFSLYLFLGWAFWTIWQDLRRQRQIAATSLVPALSLTELVEATDQVRRVHRFITDEVLVGRDPACTCNFDDATLSARHARLAYHHGQWWVEDLASTNGTYLNGSMVQIPLVLTAGDELRCGRIVLQVTFGQGTPAESDL